MAGHAGSHVPHRQVMPTVAQRFWSKVDTSAGPTACWPWTGAKSAHGYGHMQVERYPRKRYATAQRVAWTLTRGAIPAGYHVDHLCKNPPCVNPAHLEPVTPFTNTVIRSDGPAGENHRKTACRRGHPFTPANTRVSRYGRTCRRCHADRQAAYRAGAPQITGHYR